MLVMGILAAVAACGSDDTQEAASTDDAATTEAAADSADTTAAAPDPTEPAPDTTQPEADDEPADVDASSIDWATVDVTTIDWATIDMTQVDFEALRENPTVTNLDEETSQLIASRMPTGDATLTVGDEVYEFDEFGCAFGHEATESDVYAFSSNAFGQVGDVPVQMQANIRDESGEGRHEGPDVTHEVFINDVENFDDPALGWEMMAPEGITIDGNTVTAEGAFDDLLTDGDDQVPGSLDATCGAQSRR